jgi:transcriptional regulator with XRE-family HTH domain
MKGKLKMSLKICLYNWANMAGRPPTKDAPPFGQRLAAARLAKGLSQIQLARLLNTTQKTIDYYERRAVNPTLEFIERAAQVLDVGVAELLGNKPEPRRAKPGPVSQLQRRFEQIKRLPRKEQEFVLKFLDTVLEKHKKAS